MSVSFKLPYALLVYLCLSSGDFFIISVRVSYFCGMGIPRDFYMYIYLMFIKFAV